MYKRLWVILTAGFVVVSPVLMEAEQQGQAPTNSAISPQRELLDRYCVTCHNGDFVRGTDEPRSLLVLSLIHI